MQNSIEIQKKPFNLSLSYFEAKVEMNKHNDTDILT